MRGRDKLLERLNTTPVLRLMAERALTVSPTFVTVPDLDHERCAVLPDQVNLIAVPDASKGMSRSLCVGVNALPDTATGVIILPADMPDITAGDLTHIKSNAEKTTALILRATTQDAKPGHPIYFDRSLFPLFENLKGDRGAFSICADNVNQTEFIALNGQRARLDLDTPEDWEMYRKTLAP